MTHKHLTPQPDCFGCKVAGIGFGALRSQSANPVQNVPVIADEGARAGKTVGQHAIHWDGRQDATVYAPKLTIETKAREI